MKGKTKYIYIFACLLLSAGCVLLMAAFPFAGISGMRNEETETSDVKDDSAEYISETGEDIAPHPEELPENALTSDADMTSLDDVSVTVQESRDNAGISFEDMSGEELSAFRKKYDRIVVIDPGHGGGDHGIEITEDRISEKDITMDIAYRIKRILEGEGICVIFTREGDENADADKRIFAADSIPADIFVSIHVSEDDDTYRYGVSGCYNADFYSPELTGERLTDIILKKLADATGQKILSDDPVRAGTDDGNAADTQGKQTQEQQPQEQQSQEQQSQEQQPQGKQPQEQQLQGQLTYSVGDHDAVFDIIRNIMIPSAGINVGMMSNMQDRRLLERDDYREKCAEGIAGGILEALNIAN